VWSIERGGKIYRLTFSKSLAEYISSLIGPCEINRRTFMVGRRLEHSETSRSGLYAIVDCRKNMTLRITMFLEIATLLRADSRYIAEAWIMPD